MISTKAWMLGAAMLVGALGFGATKAQAAEWGVYVSGPSAYVPPCPGPGYFWTAGYYSGGYWVPGRWDFRGYDRDRVVVRGYDRDDFYRNRDWDHDRDRGFYRDRDDHHFGHDRDHDRR